VIILKKGDITREAVDAIVNAANTQLKGGGGVDGAIHRAAGPTVMEECRKIGHCPTGEAVATGAGKLRARHVIHTAGPVWGGGKRGEAERLKSCYENSFRLAQSLDVQSIAFPAISTGVYGYPLEDAAVIALGAGKKQEINFLEIRYVCFSDADLSVYDRVWSRLQCL